MSKDEWQDISTAPRDGTEILLCNEDGVTTGHWVKWANLWCSESDNPWERPHDSNYFEEYLEKGLEPTLWQPLPEPPKEKE